MILTDYLNSDTLTIERQLNILRMAYAEAIMSRYTSKNVVVKAIFEDNAKKYKKEYVELLKIYQMRCKQQELEKDFE